MTTSLLTPFDFSQPVSAGRRRFWKQVLPVTSIDYDGQQIDFDDEFHRDLLLSWEGEAYPQVPVVFADSENRHNMDPRNFAGEVLDLQNRGKHGTWALIEADRAGAKAIKANPRLGVSARIVQNLKKGDRTFKRAINHVLLTMNPRVAGMEPWQAVDLSKSADDTEVVDLTALDYEGSDMGNSKTARRRQIDLSLLNDEQFETLIDLATTTGVLEADDEDLDGLDLETDEDEEEDVEPRRKPRKKKSKTKVTVEKESEDDGDDEDEDVDEDEEDEEDEDVNLSEPVRRQRRRLTVDRTARRQVRDLMLDLAESRWEKQRGDLIRAGVPSVLLDLAEPVLKEPDAITIDLSDGESVDPQKVILDMLDAAKGTIDMSDESGHSVDLSATDDPELKALEAQWDEQYS